MKALFDVVHPADVHFFKNVIQAMLERNDEVLVTSRDKDITISLLDKLGIPNRQISTKGKGTLGLLAELIKRDYELLKVASYFNPDIFISNNSPCGSHVAWFKRKPSIVFDDTEIHRYNQRLYYPFVTEVHSPDCYQKNLGRKHKIYPGYHALAYLHPNHFCPDRTIIEKMGLSANKKIVLFRFVSWGAMHDVGLDKLSASEKVNLVKEVCKYAKVIISSEAPLEDELEPFRIDINFAEMHHLLASIDLVVAESATMCSEAAVLGTPTVYIDEKGRGYTDELEEKYGLCFNFKPNNFIDLRKKVMDFLEDSELRDKSSNRHAMMLKDKIDVSEYQLQQIDRLHACV